MSAADRQPQAKADQAKRMLAPFVPGDWVENPQQPDWGPGQVQSAIGARVTVNFLHAGKRLINTDQAMLRPAKPPED
jgi:hypothetical protein